MANIDASGARTYHGTLVANQVDTITLQNFRAVEVLNRGSDDIFVTADGSVPSINGAGTDIVPAGTSAIVRNPTPSDSFGSPPGALILKMISAGSGRYSLGLL